MLCQALEIADNNRASEETGKQLVVFVPGKLVLGDRIGCRNKDFIAEAVWGNRYTRKGEGRREKAEGK
jgi:hypothetical protein